MNKYSTRVGVVGAAGYAGAELLARLARHPSVELAAAMGSGREGRRAAVADLAPGWTGRTGLRVEPASPAAMAAARPDFVFLATPPEASMEWALALEGRARVIDLSGAFRFPDPAVFERWYGMAHAAPGPLAAAVYGWPEKNREAIRGAALVANPGCYATAAATALWPLAAAGMIEPGGIICDAKSGASGAGRGLRQDLHFAELDGNCRAYAVYAHRHAPEIAATIGLTAAEAEGFTFTPHLLPATRGILATTYVRLQRPDDAASIAQAIAQVYAAAYEGHPFTRVRGGELPELIHVAHTNFCDLGFRISPDGRAAVVVTCLDNLVKGAAGQALQNFNLMAGWPETAGLL